MKTKLITGRYKGYEVCYANKGQIFPRDGWYLTKGDDVIYIEDALAKTREETIREVEDKEIEIQNILEPYFVVLDGRDNEPAQETIIEISKKILELLNKLKK